MVLAVFEGVDLLDLGGPYEVLLTAARLLERDGVDAPVTVRVAALRPGPVRAYGGLGLVADVALADVGRADVLVVPGAIDTTALVGDTALVAEVGRLAASAELVLGVCTGAFLLGEAGVLADRAWTTHHEDVDDLAARLGPAGAHRGVRWVDTGRVVTAAGLSSGIAAALHVVERRHGRELAVRTAAQIEYDWSPDSGVSTGG